MADTKRRSSASPLWPLLDVLLFSSTVAALVAGSLAWAAGLALAGGSPWQVVALAFSGTLVVYNVDRLRDLPRDRADAPLRSAFVEAHRTILTVLTGLTCLASLVLAVQLDTRVWLLCAPALVVGLLHRRIKQLRPIKSLYVSGVWIAIVLGLPALAASEPWQWSRLLQIAIVMGSAIGANLIAFNLPPRSIPHRSTISPLAETTASGSSELRAGVLMSAAGTLLALFGLPGLEPLAAIPLAEGLAIAGYRDGERYSLAVVDGALLLGAMVAIVALQTGASGNTI